MATRNLTGRFETARNRCRMSGGRNGGGGAGRSGSGAGEVLLDEVSIRVGLEHTLPPEWVDIVDGIQGDLADIRGKLRDLGRLHTARLDVTFGDDDARQEREIEIMSAEITRLFRKAENSLKRVATVGNAMGTNLPAQERAVRLNVMRSCATDMQALSKAFRNEQRDFVTALQKRDKASESWGFEGGDEKENLTFAEAMDRGFTRQNMQQLEEMEQTATEREREILRIAQSVSELAQLFKELNCLVIEQGSIVDRIDYNVDQVLTKVKAGNVELKKADDYSKKARSIICILVLLIICIILIMILAFRNQDDDKSSDNQNNKSLASLAARFFVG